MERTIFHIDVNSAFLSWTAVDMLEHGETLDIRTIPSIIGGDSASRHGIVLAKSVPAKAYGIVTAETVASAFRKCPILKSYSPDYRMYQRRSREMMSLLRNYTDDIQQLSVDECFLDFTPIAHQYESPMAAATIIKEEIKSRLGFTVNIGIAPNKLLAKMASDFTKPDRIHTLYPDEIPGKMWPLSVDDLYMVGHSSATRLKSLGIRTIGELAATDPEYLKQEFKSHGQLMWEYANGIADNQVITEKREEKSIGNSTTVSHDVTTAEEAKRILLALSDSVSARLRKSEMLAQSITVEIKYSDFTNNSHQMGLLSPTNITSTIYDTACTLFDTLWNGQPIRLLGVRSAKLLHTDAPVQLSLFDMMETTVSSSGVIDNKNSLIPNEEDNMQRKHSTLPPANPTEKKSSYVPSQQKLQQLDHAIDSIRTRYGDTALVRGSSLLDKK